MLNRLCLPWSSGASFLYTFSTPWGAYNLCSYISVTRFLFILIPILPSQVPIYTWVEWSRVGNAFLAHFSILSQWRGWESNPGPLAWQASIVTTGPLRPQCLGTIIIIQRKFHENQSIFTKFLIQKTWQNGQQGWKTPLNYMSCFKKRVHVNLWLQKKQPKICLD